MAPIALLSHSIVFSPDAGLNFEGTVVVVTAATVVVVATGVATTVVSLLDFCPHADNTATAATHNKSFFIALVCRKPSSTCDDDR